MSAFGFGAFVGGFAKRELEKEDQRKLKEQQDLQLQVKDMRSSTENYRKNLAIRNDKKSQASQALKSSRFSPSQIKTAGDSTRWKGSDKILKFLKENFAEPTELETTGQRLIEDSEEMFGPTPTPPTLPQVDPGRSGGLLDVFRARPGDRVVQPPQDVQPTSFTPVVPQTQQASLIPGANLGAPVSALKRAVDTTEVSAFTSRARREGAFRPIDSEQAALAGTPFSAVQSINRINTPFRNLQAAIGAELMAQGLDNNSAFLEAEDQLVFALDMPAFQRELGIIQGDIGEGDFDRASDTGKLDIFQRDEQGNITATEPSPEFNSIVRLLDEYTDNPQIFESAVRAFNTVVETETLDEAISVANDMWFDRVTDTLESTSTSQEDFDAAMANSIQRLPRLRREEMLARLRASQDVENELEFVDPQATQEESPLLAPERDETITEALTTPEPPLKQEETSIEKFGEGVRETVEGISKAIEAERADPTTLAGLGEAVERTTLNLIDSAKESLSDFIQSVKPENFEKSVSSVLEGGAQEAASMVNTFSPSGQRVATSLFKAADKRNQSLSNVLKSTVAARLREDPDGEDLFEYVEDNEGGVRNEIFKDSRGNDTIGIGFNLDRSGAKKTLTDVLGPTAADDIIAGRRELSNEEARELFTQDLASAELDARNLIENFDEIPDRVQKVLIDLSFNLGGTGLSRLENFLSAVSQQNWEVAVDELMDSDYAFQTGGRAVRNAMLIAREIGIQREQLTQQQLDERTTQEVRSGLRTF